MISISYGDDKMKTEQEKKGIIEKYRGKNGFGSRAVLENIPKDERVYKCHTCHSIVDENPCPVCKETRLEIMCPLDHCECTHTEPSGVVAYCPLCGEMICPECGTHDVVVISRVTGYLSDVSGWGQGKRAEFKDRTRYNTVLEGYR